MDGGDRTESGTEVESDAGSQSQEQRTSGCRELLLSRRLKPPEIRAEVRNSCRPGRLDYSEHTWRRPLTTY